MAVEILITMPLIKILRNQRETQAGKGKAKKTTFFKDVLHRWQAKWSTHKKDLV